MTEKKIASPFLNEANWKMCIWLRNWFIALRHDSIFKLTQFFRFYFCIRHWESFGNIVQQNQLMQRGSH
jgi:hypothetical protein